MIHVCFGLHDKTGRYSKFTGTAMLSIFENISTPPQLPSITVHILHDNTLTQDNRDKFIYLAGRYGQLVKFYNVEELCADKINEFIELIPAIKIAWSTIGTFFKFLISKILPVEVEKVIYLDSDIIVNLDIKELWQIEIGTKPLAAVPEIEANSYNYKIREAAKKYLINEGFVEYEDYFNAGVFVMNLEYLRNAENLLMNGVKWRGEHTQCNCFDQDIWNYLFSKNYFKLPVKFDRFVYNERPQGINQIQKAIYHYAVVAINLDMIDPFNRLWMEYFMKTPWFDAESIGNLYESFRQNQIELKYTMIKFSSALSGKTRAFIVSAEYFEAIREIFRVRSDEEIISINSNTIKLQDLLDAMNTVASRGEKVFIVMVPNFSFDTFEQFGFVYGENLFNGFDFLSEAHGLQSNSYPLIKAM